MSTSWIRAFALLVGSLAMAAALLRASWSHIETLTPWAQAPQVGWSAVALLPLPLAALLATASYTTLRNPRLYALPFLLMPLAAIQQLHYLNQPGRPRPQAGAVLAVTQPGGAVEVVKAARRGQTQAAQGGAPRQFTGLPDSVAKRHPELPGQLARLCARLHGFTFPLLGLAVLLASLAGVAAARPRLRAVTLLAVGFELAALGAIARWGPPDLAALGPRALPLLLGSAAAATLLSFAGWRSPAGLQGGVAGLTLFLVPAGLAQLGTDLTTLGLDLKAVPPACERVLTMAFPSLVLLVVGHEWVMGMSHSTQTDALTQVFNKAYAEAIVEQTGATELGSRFAVALADIDHFKKVNDTHGHGAGDVVLQAVARAISRTITHRGLVCRTGGEEITVFFPGADVEGAREIAEEVRAAVEELVIPAKTNSGRTERLRVTLSIGVASNLTAAGSTRHTRVRDVVEAADRALYTAKANGRNQVVVAD